MVNLDKSEIIFSRNVHEEVKEKIHNRRRIKTVPSHVKYLGLPIVFGRSKKEVSVAAIERFRKKVKS